MVLAVIAAGKEATSAPQGLAPLVLAAAAVYVWWRHPRPRPTAVPG